MNRQEMENKSKNLQSQIYCAILKESTSKPVFRDEIEKKKFLDLLLEARWKFPVEWYAYCVLDETAFLLMGADEQKPAVWALEYLRTKFAEYYACKYHAEDILLQYRCSEKGIRTKREILEECVQLHEKPRRLGWVENAEYYWWSSMKEYVRKYESGIVCPEPILESLDPDMRKAVQKLRKLQKSAGCQTGGA